MGDKHIDIVFDGPPGPTAGRFVEVEQDGQSIGFGEWINDGDFWRLRFPDPRPLAATVEHMDEICHTRETRIATLEATLKEMDKLELERITTISTLKAQVKDLEAELAGWQQNYADQMSDPKQRQAYLSQLEKRKKRGRG